ncbi:uncharacterized protein LOC100572241 isoform X1 [Acyrthosiphon pisum]|uniref:Uncharacterized protein n=1 Tax=Acyrthosiphon pisum TaxID=7029 RepID=A0A8R2NUM6_ACYPI|nr:uncharacterized protein LOC100572241 isoform X1 [Acyrthosiphon pisum]
MFIGEFHTFNMTVFKFFEEKKMTIVQNRIGDTLLNKNNHHLFDTVAKTNSMKTDFTNLFFHNGNQLKMVDRAKKLTLKIKFSENYPLGKFVAEYKPTGDTGYLKNVSAFCTEYSVRPYFEAPFRRLGI